MKKILVVGATSAIAKATCRLYAERGDRLFLVARDRSRLEVVAEDLRAHGADGVEVAVMDALEYDQHEAIINIAVDTLGGLDTVLIAHGDLPDQEACAAEFSAAARALEVNFLSVVSLLTDIANRMEAQKSGTIIVVSSVAGDRGRQSNYVYGTAKSATSTFLSGLRNRLFASGVQVVDVRPGFVDTPMTEGLASDSFMWAKPEDIAAGILKADEKGRDIVYLPWFWRWIMLIIRSIPEFIFKRLGL